MRRREYLSTLGACSLVGIAGCSNGAAVKTDRESRGTQLKNDSLPEDYSFELHTTVKRDIGGSAPPLIRVGLESETRQKAFFGPYPPLDTPTATQKHGENELLIIPPKLDKQEAPLYYPADDDVSEFVPEDKINGCWTAKADVGTIAQLGVAVPFAPGETFAQEYNILNHPGNSGCFPSGDYIADTHFTVNDVDYEWSFTIRL